MQRVSVLVCAVVAAWVGQLSFGGESAVGNPEIVSAVQPFVDRKVLAGAVMIVADKEKFLCEETAGFADVAGNKPMPKDAIFWIASQNKPITGAALMMLVDEGKVKLEDPVEKYLPEFKGIMVIAEKTDDHVLLKKPGHLITVAEIMSHTAGLEFKAPPEEPTLDLLPLKTAVKANAAMPLVYEPGTKYQYSNAGINAGGRIIEVVSGMPYEEFLQKRLFDPLGMKDTTFWPSEEQLTRLAKSYKPNADKTAMEETIVTQLKYPLSDRIHRYPFPAGGLFSSAHDCARFCQMVLNGGELDGKRYLSEAAVKNMTSRHTPETLKESYGVGWSVSNGGAGHGGAYSTNMSVDFTHGLVFVWLVQHAGFPAGGEKAQEAFKHAAMEKFGKK